MKNRKVYVTTFCGVAVAMNIVLGIITSALGIPLYLDTLGTVLSAAILGPVPGIIVGALSNIITGLIYRKMISTTVMIRYIPYKIRAVDIAFGTSLSFSGPGTSARIRYIEFFLSNDVSTSTNTSTPIPPIQ